MSKFTTLRTLTGWDVVDAETGHTVAERPSQPAAQYAATMLNAGNSATLESLRSSYHRQDAQSNPSVTYDPVSPSDPTLAADSLVLDDTGWGFDDPELSMLHSES